MILPIYAYGFSVLKKAAEDIDKDYPELEALLSHLWETMYNAHGIGLAAPQVGLSIRLFLVDTKQSMEEEEKYRLFFFRTTQKSGGHKLFLIFFFSICFFFWRENSNFQSNWVNWKDKMSEIFFSNSRYLVSDWFKNTVIIIYHRIHPNQF